MKKQTLNLRLHLRKSNDKPDATHEELLESLEGALGILEAGPGAVYHGDVEEAKPSLGGFFQELRQHEPGCANCDAYVQHVREALGLRGGSE